MFRCSHRNQFSILDLTLALALLTVPHLDLNRFTFLQAKNNLKTWFGFQFCYFQRRLSSSIVSSLIWLSGVGYLFIKHQSEKTRLNADLISRIP